MGFFDFGTIFFLIAAVVIFFQLRNVLGRRTGNERPPFDPYSASRTREADAAQKPENVVSLPRERMPGETAAETYADIDAFAKPDPDLNKGLRTIKDNDASFDPKTFADGANGTLVYTVNGKPPCKTTMFDMCHPPSTALAKPP